MKRILYILVVFLLAQSAVGQNKLANAHYSLKNKEYEKAKELIDAASIDTLFQDVPATWYYKGHIYKELYKEQQGEDFQSPYRVVAIESFIKCIEIEPEGVYSESSRAGLSFLANRIFNEAASTFDENNYPTSLATYEYHKTIMLAAYPETDFRAKDIMIKMRLASVYNNIAEQDTVNAEMYYSNAEKEYLEVLKIDSLNVSANFNLGIIYYNKGVEIVNNMDYSLDLDELLKVQEEIIVLFKKSLPYMKVAYDLNPSRKETLIGLQGIYFSLNDIPKSETYKKELESLDETDELETTPPVDEDVQD